MAEVRIVDAPDGVTKYTDIIGKTIAKIGGDKKESLYFLFTDGDVWRMYHRQSCCESVEIEDISGDLKDLLKWPLTMAEEVVYDNTNPPGKECSKDLTIYEDYRTDSFKWTFYKFATVKGYVNIRWLGTSNGFYSESVTFERVGENRMIDYFDNFEVVE